MPLRRTWPRAALLLLCLMLTSCAALQDIVGDQPAAPAVDTDSGGDATAASQPAATTPPVADIGIVPRVNDVAATAKRTPQIDLGTGTFINNRANTNAPLTVTNGGDIVLSFANADVRDVARVIMSEVLELNYSVHPQIDGAITLQTSRPLPRARFNASSNPWSPKAASCGSTAAATC